MKKTYLITTILASLPFHHLNYGAEPQDFQEEQKTKHNTAQKSYQYSEPSTVGHGELNDQDRAKELGVVAWIPGVEKPLFTVQDEEFLNTFMSSHTPKDVEKILEILRKVKLKTTRVSDSASDLNIGMLFGLKSGTAVKNIRKKELKSPVDTVTGSPYLISEALRNFSNIQVSLKLNDDEYQHFVAELKSAFPEFVSSNFNPDLDIRAPAAAIARVVEPIVDKRNQPQQESNAGHTNNPLLGDTPTYEKGTAYVSADMAGLFSNEDFINSAIEEAHKGNLTALFHVQRILEMHSETSADERYVLAQAVGKRLETESEAAMNDTDDRQDWQSWYQRSIASIYLNRNAIETITQALTFEDMPDEYRKDLLRRAFNISPDTKWADDGINHGFKEFYLFKASRPTNKRPSTIAERIASRNASFSVLEEAIKHDTSKAYFEIGKGVLSSEYELPATSKIKTMNEFKELKDKDLGLALVFYSLNQGVSPALTFLIDYYDEDRDAALKYCKLACTNWEQSNNSYLSYAHFQEARILESQFKIKEAIESYKKAGPLLGYTDAARLAQPALDKENPAADTSEWFLQRKQEKENEILTNLKNILGGVR